MTGLRKYHGPPGDEREYWLPRDRDDLDAAWDRYFAEHPERDPSKNADEPVPDATDEPVF